MVLSGKAVMTESVRQREREVSEAIRNGKECSYLYCITMPSNNKNLLDIHSYRELHKRKEYDDEPFIILGLAENRKEAVNLIYDMVSEVAASLERPEDFKKDFLSYRDDFLSEENRKE